MNKEQRAEVRERATKMHNAYQQMGDHAGQRVCEIAMSALDYADTCHVANANHFAGDCDQCSARHSLKELEGLLGGPATVDQYTRRPV
jgi:hypothetical protein